MEVTPVMQALFDGLMEKIEPDLMIANRAKVSKKLAAMKSEERAKTIKKYGECFAEFIAQWPAYLKKATNTIERIIKSTEMSDISQQINNTAPSANQNPNK